MKVLVVLSRIPFPLEKGDKLRAYHQLKEISKQHEVYLCCLTDVPYKEEWITEIKKICQHVQVIKLNKILIYWNVFKQSFTGKPFQVGYFYQKRAENIIHKAIDDFQPDHIYCQLIRTAEYVKNHYNIPKTIDYMDALSKGMERRMDAEKGLKKMLFRSEYKRLLKYEHLIFDYFENKTIISEQDQQHIYHPDQKEIVVIPNGVSEFFKTAPKVEKKFEMVFTGNMMYPPNVNGAIYLVEKILPLLKQQMPEARVLISGANPHKSVQDLASDDVIVTGWVEDMRESICAAHVYVAPMEIGSGVQNKLLESMALGVPCVTSALANKGLKAEKDKEVMIAQNPQEYADAVVRIINDESLASSLSKSGKDFVNRHFSWEASTKRLLTRVIHGVLP